MTNARDGFKTVVTTRGYSLTITSAVLSTVAFYPLLTLAHLDDYLYGLVRAIFASFIAPQRPDEGSREVVSIYIRIFLTNGTAVMSAATLAFFIPSMLLSGVAVFRAAVVCASTILMIGILVEYAAVSTWYVTNLEEWIRIASGLFGMVGALAIVYELDRLRHS